MDGDIYMGIVGLEVVFCVSLCWWRIFSGSRGESKSSVFLFFFYYSNIPGGFEWMKLSIPCAFGFGGGGRMVAGWWAGLLSNWSRLPFSFVSCLFSGRKAHGENGYRLRVQLKPCMYLCVTCV